VSKNFYRDYFSSKQYDAKKNQNEITADGLLDLLYPTFNAIYRLTNPLEYRAVEKPNFKNVLVLGNMGAGKSTILNKLSHCIQNCNDLEKQFSLPVLDQHFLSKQSIKSVTDCTTQKIF